MIDNYSVLILIALILELNMGFAKEVPKEVKKKLKPLLKPQDLTLKVITTTTTTEAPVQNVTKGSKSVLTMVSDLVYNLQLTVNQTQTAKRKMCLEYTQDSGFWCEGTVGKLENRFYYQKETKTCECFLYYGCFGNTNNFETIKECEDKCGKQFGFSKTNKNKQKTNCVINP